MTRLASADSEPRTMKVSLSSAARCCSGPCSGAMTSASASQVAITAQRGTRLDPAADAFDLGDDALLGIDVDELRVQLDGDGLTLAILDRDRDLARVRAGLPARLVELETDQFGGIERVLGGPILGLAVGLGPRLLERTLDRGQVGALRRLLVFTAPCRDRDARDSEQDHGDKGDCPPCPHSDRKLASGTVVSN